jgi:hypothetical protein
MSAKWLKNRPIVVALALIAALALPAVLFSQTAATEESAHEPEHEPEPEHRIDLEKSFEVPHQEENHPSHSPCVVFTADGRRMVTATSEGEIVEFDAKTHRIVRRIPLPEGVTSAISIDPQARRAVAALEKGLVVVDLEQSAVIKTDNEIAAKCVAISPDASLVALTNANHWEIRELPSLKLLSTIQGYESPWTNVTWSADGTLLAATAENGQLVVHHRLDDRPVYQVRKEGALHAVAFHPAGERVAYGGHDRNVYEYSIPSEEEQVLSSDQPYWITCLGYSPDGEILAVGDESCDIWLYERASRKLLFHNKHHVECWLSGVGWAPDNESFLFGCRPNSHEGKPSVYQPLVVAEAAQAEEVCRQREQLLTHIEQQLQTTSDERQRQALENARAVLVAQNEKTNFAGSLKGQQQLQVDGPAPQQLANAPPQSLPAALQLAANPPPLNVPVPQPAQGAVQQAQPVPEPTGILVEELPSELQDIARAYQSSLQKEMRRLNENHCINQWRLKRGGDKP